MLIGKKQVLKNDLNLTILITSLSFIKLNRLGIVVFSSYTTKRRDIEFVTQAIEKNLNKETEKLANCFFRKKSGIAWFELPLDILC